MGKDINTLNLSFSGNLQKVSISSDDKLVITTEMILTEAQRKTIQENILKIFPDNQCLILDGGLKLSIASK